MAPFTWKVQKRPIYTNRGEPGLGEGVGMAQGKCGLSGANEHQEVLGAMEMLTGCGYDIQLYVLVV